MKKIKYVILILIIIVIFLLLGLWVNKIVKKNNEVIQDLSGINGPNGISKVGYTELFAVSNCISTYLRVLDINNIKYYEKSDDGYKFIATNKEIADNLLALMSESYKKSENIDSSNVLSKVKMQKQSEMLTLTKVEKIAEGNVQSYLAQGFTSTSDYKFIRDICFIVNVDNINKTFSIEELGENIDSKNIKNEKIDNIEKNNYNKFVDGEIKTTSIVNSYINDFKTIMLVKPNTAYELLDKEYREKRFGSYQKFAAYVEKNKSEIITLSAEKYKINYNDDYKEYIIIDANGNYYRFRENNVMDYTVMLDVYTIDLPEFLEEFNNGDENKKVGLCIERFLQMINAEDYESAYSLLDDTFKQNNFKTLDEFTEYIQANFNYKNNLKSIDSLKKEGKYYICTVSIENAKFPLNEPIQRSFVIKFEEGTGFKMAINLD